MSRILMQVVKQTLRDKKAVEVSPELLGYLGMTSGELLDVLKCEYLAFCIHSEMYVYARDKQTFVLYTDHMTAYQLLVNELRETGRAEVSHRFLVEQLRFEDIVDLMDTLAEHRTLGDIEVDYDSERNVYLLSVASQEDV